jgi:hypothetical protein
LIANRNESLNQIERTFQSSPEEKRWSQSNQTNQREAQNSYSSRMGSSTSVQNPVTQLAEKSGERKTDFVIDINKSKNKKSETNPKKTATKLSANKELEENLVKLDEVIDYYNQLKTRIYRTLISRPKNSKAAKDVILELKDVIKKFDNKQT